MQIDGQRATPRGGDRHTWFRLRVGAVVLALASAAIGNACGSDAGSPPARETAVVLESYEDGDDYKFRAEGTLDIRAGDRVTIELRNTGRLLHDLAVIHPDGSTIATMDPIGPGATGTLTFDIEEPGYYRFNCNVDNHLTQHGMQAVVDVLRADGTSINA